MEILYTNLTIVTAMQEQRGYLEKLENISSELFDLSLKLGLDHKEQIEIEASIKRIDKIYEKQYDFVKSIEKIVLKEDFVKRNGKRYNERDNIIKIR